MTEVITDTPAVDAPVVAPVTTDWRASLPEDIRGSKVFDSVTDVNSLAKQFIDAQSHIGNSIRVPGEDASQEAVDAFHAKLMNKTDLMIKPQTSEDYAKVFESMGKPVDSKGYVNPEGIEGYDSLRELALNANMTGKQFESMIQSVSELDAAALETQQNSQKESRGVVEKEWGAAFDQNSSQAIALLEATGAPESLVALAKNGDIGGPELKWFHALSQKLSGGEGSTAVGDEGHNQIMTPAEASSQIREIMENREGPYWHVNDSAARKDIRLKVEGLRKLGGRGS